MIVKVQLSISGTVKQRRILIYDKDRKHQYDSEASKEMVEYFDNAPKSFWHAKLKGDEFEILKPAPWQFW